MMTQGRIYSARVFPRHTSMRQLVTGLFYFCLSIAAVSVRAEDLMYHYEHALQSDPKLRSSEANRNAVQERLSQAGGGLLPMLTTNAARNRNDQEVVTDASIFSQPPGNARYSSTEYRLNLSQPIYNAAIFAGWQGA